MHHQYVLFVIKKRVGGEWALSMVGVEEGREFRFRGDLYSQESTFSLVIRSVVASHCCRQQRSDLSLDADAVFLSLNCMREYA